MGESRCWSDLMTLNNCAFQELPMHEIVSSQLKKTLNARLQPVSFEINNLLLLLFDDDDGVEVLAAGVCELELELEYKTKQNTWTRYKNCWNLQKTAKFDAYELCAILLIEKMRTEPSAQQDANFEPLEFHTILFTSAEWSFSSLSWEPAAKSNIRIFDSSPPAAKYRPSGLKLTQCTGKWQSIKTRDNWPLVTSHKRTVKSVDPVAI